MQSVFCSILLYPILFRNTLPSNGTTNCFPSPSGTQYMQDGSYSPGSLTSYGSRYNWCASVANNCGNIGSVNQSSDIDICPRNWRLPLGGTDNVDNSYYKLWSSYGGSSGRSALNNAFPLVQAGRLVGGCGGLNDGFTGYWWTATRATNLNGVPRAYDLKDATKEGVYGIREETIPHGISVRCVAKL